MCSCCCSCIVLLLYWPLHVVMSNILLHLLGSRPLFDPCSFAVVTLPTSEAVFQTRCCRVAGLKPSRKSRAHVLHKWTSCAPCWRATSTQTSLTKSWRQHSTLDTTRKVPMMKTSCCGMTWQRKQLSKFQMPQTALQTSTRS